MFKKKLKKYCYYIYFARLVLCIKFVYEGMSSYKLKPKKIFNYSFRDTNVFSMQTNGVN